MCSPVFLGSGSYGDGYKVYDMVVKCFWCCHDPKPINYMGTQGRSRGKKCLTCGKSYRDPTYGNIAFNEELALNNEVLTNLDKTIVTQYTPIVDTKDKGTKYKSCKKTIQLFKPIPYIVSRGGKLACDLFAVMSEKQKPSKNTTNPHKYAPGILDHMNTYPDVFVLKLIDCLFNVCNGLKNNNLYHHDIKPENIFVSLTYNDTLNVVLGDYGLMAKDKNSPAGTPGYIGFDPIHLPRFVENRLWLRGGTNLTNKLGKSGTQFYFCTSWDRTLYSIAKTCADLYEFWGNHFLLQIICMCCLWKIAKNDSDDLKIVDCIKPDFANHVGFDIAQFKSLYNIIIQPHNRTQIGGLNNNYNIGSKMTGQTITYKLLEKSGLQTQSGLPMWNFKKTEFRERLITDRCGEPFKTMTDEGVENIKMQYYTDIETIYEDKEEEAEVPIQFPQGVQIASEPQEGGGSSSSRASKWASIALGAVVTLVASLVKR